METIYTVYFFEEGLRSEGFYEFEKIEDFWHYLAMHAHSKRKVTVYIRKHEVKHRCDVCSSDSVVEEIKLVIEK